MLQYTPFFIVLKQKVYIHFYFFLKRVLNHPHCLVLVARILININLYLGQNVTVLSSQATVTGHCILKKSITSWILKTLMNSVIVFCSVYYYRVNFSQHQNSAGIICLTISSLEAMQVKQYSTHF